MARRCELAEKVSSDSSRKQTDLDRLHSQLETIVKEIRGLSQGAFDKLAHDVSLLKENQRVCTEDIDKLVTTTEAKLLKQAKAESELRQSADSQVQSFVKRLEKQETQKREQAHEHCANHGDLLWLIHDIKKLKGCNEGKSFSESAMIDDL